MLAKNVELNNFKALLWHPKTEAKKVGGVELVEEWMGNDQAYIWVNFDGTNPSIEEQQLREWFDIHPHAIQDALRERHPPKIEEFESFSFLLLKGLHSKSSGAEFKTIQLAIFVGDRLLLTRSSEGSPSIDALWEQTIAEKKELATTPGKLALQLSRKVVDRYLRMLLSLEPRLVKQEVEMVDHPSDDLLAEITRYKTNLKQFRRIFLYHVQMFDELKRGEFPGISSELAHDINDVFEQQERSSTLADLYYEMASDLIDGYISLASHRLNNIMKVLTIITAIFVPLSFLAGIYGMNFPNMPELKNPSGYYILLGVMATIVAVLLWIFRRKRWL